MKKMTSGELRSMWLNFFKSKGHAVIPSASVIPENDPTVLFTTAGMHPLVPYLLGSKHPAGTRLTDVQKCIRTGDIDEVGDASHLTFFEMLGNWSLGDYFKKEMIAWSWEFLTSPEYLGLDKDKLAFTVFEGEGDIPRDEEAANYWMENGVKKENIYFLPREHNWWGPAGQTGPCGPDTEMFIIKDQPPCGPNCSPACSCGRFLEIWNDVFMQYNKTADGQYVPMAKKNVDTGMGFERLCMILQGKKSNYDTDVFQPTIGRIAEMSGKKYGEDRKADVAMRVIADHLRAIAFSIADGQLPSNVKAGYVIRRILRRAVRYGYTYLGFTEPTLCRLVPGLVGQMGGQFPELKAQQGLIEKVIEEEESSFLRTLATGINLLDGVISRTKGEGKELISGKDAFELYDTFGFPIDLTELIAREQGVGVDLAAFEKELQAQKERSRNAAAVDTDDWVELFPIRESIFTGYDTLTEKVRIARYRRVTSKGKTSYQLVFDRTPFYGNSGGQVGDIGMIESANERIPVVATEKENGLIIHIVNQLPENPAAEFTARVDPEKRQAAANNHTATHLMHEALRKVLGAHVEQKGSLVTPEILRFDFSHFQKVTPEELRKVEQLVNRAIRANYPLVENREATKEEAEKCGAMMLFGEKYGDKVRMVRFGSSVELCGGTHTGATGNIGFFKILSESAISAGVRRIEAVTGEQAEKVLYAAEDTMRNIAEYLNNPQVVQAVKKMLESNETLSKEVESMRREQVAQWADKIAASTPERHGMQLFATQTDRRPDFVKDLAYNLRQRSPRLVFVVGSVWDGKPTLTVMLGDEITACGVNAGAVVREAAKLMQGGGGGQAFFATAGGKNPDGLQAAIDKAVELIGAQVK